ncbi:MAG: CvpA family protein [Cryomorphaceae bacterium]|nr:CvpA family protein [Cryomorphaceae bacterium]
MSILDIFLVILPIAMAYYGFRAGFIKTFFSLTIFIIILVILILINKDFLLGYYNRQNMEMFDKYWVWIIILILLGIAVISFIMRKFKKLFKRINLGPLDQVLGAVGGLFQGILLTMMLVFLLQSSNISTPGWFGKMRDNSALLPKYKQANQTVINWFVKVKN